LPGARQKAAYAEERVGALGRQPAGSAGSVRQCGVVTLGHRVAYGVSGNKIEQRTTAWQVLRLGTRGLRAGCTRSGAGTWPTVPKGRGACVGTG